MKQMAHFLIIFWKEENVSAAVAHNEMYSEWFLSSDLKPHFLVNFKWLSMSGSRREQVTYILKNAMRLKKIKIFCWS